MQIINHKNLSEKNIFFLFILLTYCFLIITQNFVPMEVSISKGFNDQFSYFQIINSSPNILENPINSIRAQRFTLSYIIGGGLYYFDLKEYYYEFYLILNFLTHFLIIYFLIKTLKSVNKDDKFSLVLLLIFILNPYTFRASLFAPLILNDQLFFLGSILLIYALIKNSSFYLFFGVILASMCKQTSMVFAPCLLLYASHILFFKKKELFKFNINIIISIVIILSIFYFTYEFSRSFAKSTDRNILGTISGLFIYDYTFKELLIFILRIFVANVYIIILFILLLVKKIFFLKLDFKFYIIALIGLGIFIQPILAGPDSAAGNVNRLTVLATPFFIVFFDKILSIEIKKILINIVPVSLLFLSSLHHNYSKLYFIENFEYAALIGIICIINLIYVYKKI